MVQVCGQGFLDDGLDLVATRVWKLMDDDGDTGGYERGIALIPQSFRNKRFNPKWRLASQLYR